MTGYKGKNFDPAKARRLNSVKTSIGSSGSSVSSVSVRRKSLKGSLVKSLKSPKSLKSTKSLKSPKSLKSTKSLTSARRSLKVSRKKSLVPARAQRAPRPAQRAPRPAQRAPRPAQRAPRPAQRFSIKNSRSPSSRKMDSRMRSPRRFGRSENSEYFRGGIFEPLNYMKKVYLSLDYSTNGLAGFLVKMYGIKKAIDVWEWINNRHVYSDQNLVTTTDSITDATEKIKGYMEAPENKLRESDVYTNILDDKSNNDPPAKKLTKAQFEYYKDNLDKVNMLTSRLQALDEIYKKFNGQYYFKPDAYMYYGKHVYDPDTDTITYVQHQPAKPAETKITVTTSNDSTSVKGPS